MAGVLCVHLFGVPFFPLSSSLNSWKKNFAILRRAFVLIAILAALVITGSAFAVLRYDGMGSRNLTPEVPVLASGTINYKGAEYNAENVSGTAFQVGYNIVFQNVSFARESPSQNGYIEVRWTFSNGDYGSGSVPLTGGSATSTNYFPYPTAGFLVFSNQGVVELIVSVSES